MSASGRSFRVACALFAALFLVAAVVQWNDPDPWAWILAYGTGAGVSAWVATGRSAVVPSALLALAAFVGFATIAVGLDALPTEAFSHFTMREAEHEAPREAIGLLLLAAWSAWLALTGWRARNGAGEASR